MASLGINFCTAALGLKVRGGMKKGDLVTVSGAAGGTGLAALELSVASGNEVVDWSEVKRRQCVLFVERSRRSSRWRLRRSGRRSRRW